MNRNPRFPALKFSGSKWWKGLLRPSRTEPVEQAERIAAMQLHIVLPAKAGLAAVVYYFNSSPDDSIQSTYSLVVEILRSFFLIYIGVNSLAGLVYYFWRRFPPATVQWVVFTMGILDGLFIAGLVFLTDGYESMAYWLFAGLIVLNAVSIPLAAPQIVLNLLLSIFYLSAGVLNTQIPLPELSNLPANAFHRSANHQILHSPELPYAVNTGDTVVEPDVPRLFVLWLLAACCYGVQVMLERQEVALAEAREFGVRESQLRSAGRLAAEIAHQIKNPLAIINNAAFSLERSVRENKNTAAQQIGIIQEEVARADRVLTQIMGYAQLSEGRVEKLKVVEELNRAITQVFPVAMPIKIRIHREYAPPFPPLLMQRNHLSEIFINLLQNAREALGDKGNVFITVTHHRDHSIQISIRDDGPGIPPDKIERIFEAYYTTKDKGTGLGLSIVKHNIELYGGKIQVDSEIGIGTRFALTFPSKSILNEMPPS
ncbi:MAG TPA: HAMP domain-containing sensor histidine kinase [Verrucomicrobiae bacterium]|jgi:signal transduction histidine kinase